MRRPANLEIESVRSQLSDCRVGHTIFDFDVVTSTMPIAHDLARAPATSSGAIVIANVQSAGRGRNSRQWQALSGTSLLLSIILKEPDVLTSLATWPMLAGLAVVDALETVYPILRGRCALKWPNDILLGSSMRDSGKVAGVLIESSMRGNRVEYVIIGIGINVNQHVEELPAVSTSSLAPVSLRSFLGKLCGEDTLSDFKIERKELFIALCHSWAARLNCIDSKDSSQLFSDWRSRLWTLGEYVHINEGEQTRIVGKAVDVNHDGALIVRDARGDLHTIYSGDLSVRVAPI